MNHAGAPVAPGRHLTERVLRGRAAIKEESTVTATQLSLFTPAPASTSGNDDLERRSNSRAAVLRALRKAGKRGLTNVQLNRVAFRYGARIFELRQEGLRIDKECVAAGVYVYRLVEG